MSSDERVSKRLDRAWATQWNRDHIFELLAVVSQGVPVGIGLLVDGRVIRGVVTPEAQLFEAATAAVARPLQAFGSAWAEELQRTYLESFTRLAEQEERRRNEDRDMTQRYMDEAVRPAIDGMAEEDVIPFYRQLVGAPSLTVGQARIDVDGTTVLVDVMSVRRESISAWWFLDSEEGSPIHYGGAKADD